MERRRDIGQIIDFVFISAGGEPVHAVSAGGAGGGRGRVKAPPPRAQTRCCRRQTPLKIKIAFDKTVVRDFSIIQMIKYSHDKKTSSYLVIKTRVRVFTPRCR